MAGRGPAPDPSAERSSLSRVKQPDLDLVGPLEIPELPEDLELLPATREWWDAYWISDVAKAVQADTDARGVIRLAWLYDERDRVASTLRKLDSPTAVGSQGQMIIHPLTKYLGQLDGEIRQLEDRFGLSPRARIALGIELTKARRSLADLYKSGDPKKGEKKEAQPAKLELIGGDDLE
jgi:hypothetical protein